MASDATPPRLAGDRYRIDKHLSRGSHMDEWAGHDQRLNRSVAIWVIRDDLADDESTKALVSAHLRKAVRVEDPGLTRIYDSLEPAVVGLVAEPIAGANLRDQIAANGPMSVERARSITIEVAKALDGAHRQGLVHGGLDAGSVGFTSDGRLVIRDIGTCAKPDPGANGVADDVIALAGLLHEATCGRPPHVGGNRHELDPAVPTAVAGLISQAFSDDSPWPTGHHFAAALANEPVKESARAGFASLERRWMVPAIVVLAIAAIIGGLGALASRSSVARDILDNAREVVGLDPVSPTSTSSTTPTPTTTSRVTPTTEPREAIDFELLRITDFDPEGDDLTEHPERLTLINDGDPTRGWQTSRYTTRDFGRLKNGVGLIVELEDPLEVTSITVRSPSRGWAFELFTSDEAPTRADWGDPVRTVRDIESDTTIELNTEGVRSFLIWIIDLGSGPQFRVTVTDVEVSGYLTSE